MQVKVKGREGDLPNIEEHVGLLIHHSLGVDVPHDGVVHAAPLSIADLRTVKAQLHLVTMFTQLHPDSSVHIITTHKHTLDKFVKSITPSSELQSVLRLL